MRFCSRFALLGLMLAAGCGSASSQPNLRQLGLRVSDFPSATIPEMVHTWTNTRAAKRDGVTVRLYDQHGRQQSYSETFERHVMNGSEPTWLLRADTEITQYRDVAGAQWGYARLVRTMRHEFVWSSETLGTNAGRSQFAVRYHAISVAPIGDRDAAFTVDAGGDEVGFTRRVLIFQRGRYVEWLRVMGLLDNVAMWRVVKLAHAVDRRTTSASL